MSKLISFPQKITNWQKRLAPNSQEELDMYLRGAEFKAIEKAQYVSEWRGMLFVLFVCVLAFTFPLLLARWMG